MAPIRAGALRENGSIRSRSPPNPRTELRQPFQLVEPVFYVHRRAVTLVVQSIRMEYNSIEYDIRRTFVGAREVCR